MSNVPPTSDLGHMPGIADYEPEPTKLTPLPDPPVVEPLSDFEIDVRRQLLSIEGHLARNDSLIMQLQLDQRRGVRNLANRVDARFAELTKSIAEVVQLLKRLGNGRHG